MNEVVLPMVEVFLPGYQTIWSRYVLAPLQNNAAKAPPGSSGIFFVSSRHVESIIMMMNSGSKGKIRQVTTICSGYGTKKAKNGLEKCIFQPVFLGVFIDDIRVFRR